MRVRPLQNDDLPQLLRFLAAGFSQSRAKADPDYFRWRFAECPLGSSLPDYRIALEGDTIVGQLACLRDRLLVDGSWHDALWLVDLLVAPEHRGSLAALRLFQSLMDGGRLLLATGAGPHLLPLYQALGWQRMPVADSYYFPIRPGRLLRLAGGKESWTGKLTRPGLALADLAVPALRRLQKPPLPAASADFALCPLQRFDSAIDRLIERVQPALGITSLRSAELLRWKFDCRPLGAHWAVIAAAVSDEEPRGYLVAKRMQRGTDARWVDIVDYLVAPNDVEVFRGLLAWTQRTALEEGADFIRFRLSLPQHKALLPAPGWLKRTRPVTDEVFAFTRNDVLRERLAAGPWHLTALASDRADYGDDDVDS